MATKKVSIEFDINSEDLRIVNGETLSLTQQLRILKKELQKGDLKPEQFDILRKKIGDTEDRIAKTTVKSKDFFGVLSTLPGPVGQFGSSLLAVVDTLKIFSSFSFKDIKNSLGDIGDDVAEITGNFSNFGSVTKEVDVTTQSTAESVSNLTDNLIDAGAQAGATGGAVKGATAEIGNLASATVNLVNTNLDLQSVVKSLNEQGFDAQLDILTDINGQITDQVISYTDLSGEIQVLTDSEVKAAAAGNTLIKTNEGIKVSANGAAAATNTLGATIKGVLIGTGIGAAIVAIGFLIQKFVEWASAIGAATDQQKESTKQLTDFKVKLKDVENSILAARKGVKSKEEALKEYNDKLGTTVGFAGSLEEAERLLAANTDIVVQSINLRAQAQVFYAKSAEAAAKVISGEGLEPDFWDRTFNLFKAAGNPFAAVSYDIETLAENVGELNKQSTDFSKKGDELIKKALELEKGLIGSRTKPEDKKGGADEAYNRLLADLDARIQLEINKEKTSQVELERLLEKRAQMVIAKDKMTYKQQELLRQENKKKVEAALQEDSDRVLSFLQKRNEIRINADKVEQNREEELLAEKLYFDKYAISKETEFKKLSKEEQSQILLEMEEKYQQDLLKIKEKYFLKELDIQKETEKQKRENALSEGEQLLDLNQQLLTRKISLNDYYETLLTLNNKELFEGYFVDLRELYEQNYKDTESSIMKELTLLKTAVDEKKLTEEEYEKRVKELNQSIIQNKLDYTSKVIELDDLERSSREAVVDKFGEVAQRTLDFYNALIDIRQINMDNEMKVFDERLALYAKDSEEYNKVLAEKRAAEKSNLDKIKKMQTAAALADAAIQIARVVIDTQRAIVSFAASVAPLGPAGIPIAAAYATASKVLMALSIATITAQGIAKIKQIQSQDVSTEAGGDGASRNNAGRGYAEGGLIRGRRHAQGGTMIEAEDGEAVMTRGAVTMFAPLLSMLNQAGGGTSFNTPNMMVTSPDNPNVSNPSQNQQPIIMKTYVVENELTSTQQKQARLKDLSTL
jgi:hypothetical protein